MAVIPHSIDIVVADMAKSLRFYRAIGLNAPDFDPDEMQMQIATEGGATIGLIREADMREHNPDWQTPVGQRVTFSCRCDSPQELDLVYNRVVAAGFPAYKEPWDAFWGQRYAFLRDPDGNRVDLFAAIAPEGEE
jgi:catechol 2,3-dioxygenase-like lactoylglutathione lyase family enzyme